MFLPYVFDVWSDVALDVSGFFQNKLLYHNKPIEFCFVSLLSVMCMYQCLLAF